MSLDEAAWAEIARLWQAGEEPVTAIAQRYGLTRQKLVAVARTREWPTRGGNADRSARVTTKDGRAIRPGVEDEAATDSPDPPLRAAPAKRPKSRVEPRQSRRDMMERLFDAVDAKLIRLERHMADDGDATAADGERTARSLNSLIRSFEKLTAFEDKLGKGAGQRAGRDRSGGEGDTTEHRRQELARRIAKLREQR